MRYYYLDSLLNMDGMSDEIVSITNLTNAHCIAHSMTTMDDTALGFLTGTHIAIWNQRDGVVIQVTQTEQERGATA